MKGIDAGLLITHPDVLLSGTLVTSSLKCQRASVLQDRFGGGAASQVAVQGTMLHELFQV